MPDTLSPIAETPAPPYHAVIFTSRLNDGDSAEYEATANRMLELAMQQDGYLGFESVRDDSGVGITVSYWRDRESIQKWHDVAEHKGAQQRGRSTWYESFAVRIACVEREYDFGR